MASPPEFIRGQSSVTLPDGTTVKRGYYHSVKRGAEPPDPCASSVPQPGIGVPPGSIAFVDEHGVVQYLEPGQAGDRLRIGTDGLPVWSPT